MNKFLLRSFVLAVLLIAFSFSSNSYAVNYDNHKGFYIYAMGGFMDSSHDTNVRTGLKFGSSIVPGFGLTAGYNVTDWIAPELQIAYGTSTGQTPSGSSREHLLTIRLNAKYSFLTSKYEGKVWKLLPYVKAGGVAHALYVNAPNSNDKVGAYGFGFGVGGGLEVNYKVLYFGIDISNDFLFMQAENNNIAGVSTQITKGGFDYQISVMGAIGVHF